jgi:hypothetical protein
LSAIAAVRCASAIASSPPFADAIRERERYTQTDAPVPGGAHATGPRTVGE